jgi:3-hydroxyisobutyrate dehydrogenase-like beta-hydroxyacid dehydrogenase
LSTLAIGLVGSSPLGVSLCRCLIDGGYEVLTLAPDPTGRDSAELNGAIAGRSAADIAEFADVLVCAATSSDIDDVFKTAGGVLGAKKIPPIIDTTNIPLPMKQILRKAVVDRGSQYLDAAVDGTPAMLAAGTAEIYVSGDRDTYLKYRPVLKAMCPRLKYVGTSLNSSKVRLVAQLLATIHTTAAIEAMLYAKRAGLDVEDINELIATQHGAMRDLFGNRRTDAADGSFGQEPATVDANLMGADEIMAYAAQIGAPHNLISAAAEYYHRLSAAGWGGADPSSLFTELLREWPSTDGGTEPSAGTTAATSASCSLNGSLGSPRSSFAGSGRLDRSRPRANGSQ